MDEGVIVYLQVLLRQHAGESDRFEGREVRPPVRVLESDALAPLLCVHVQDCPAPAAGVVLVPCTQQRRE